MAEELDPIQYEIFRHRLFNILEEGRIAVGMVSGSPVVVEGGETMCSFYDAEGVPILTAAGVLLHCIGAMGFVQTAIEWYEKDPGILEGDQFFFNDPYIGGLHLPDQIIIKPIFFEGIRIAWTGTFMHTGETGGIEPGGMPAKATEIFHEGIRILGLKIVEKGKFRPEVFNTIVQQTRDPHLVGLDTKAKIAANNVCAKSYLSLVQKHGIEFVQKASRRIIEDSEKMAREKLCGLPDGIWRAREYGDHTGSNERPYKVMCTMTKKGDEITFDFTGSSPQNEGSNNTAYSGAWASLFAALASQLFWNIPWNGGMIAPVTMIAPEGSVVNCRFPGAVSVSAPTTVCMIIQVACECIHKMLYTEEKYRGDVTSGWQGGHGCPYFGGINQYGAACAGIILDNFAGGTGGRPFEDGVDTGANMMNATSRISDVEIMELGLPVMYLARRNVPDSGGFGRFRGGMGGESIYMVYGTDRLHFGTMGIGKKTPGGHGIFGGYPPDLQQNKYVLHSNILELFKESKCPTTFKELDMLKGEIILPPANFYAIPVKQFDIILFRWGAGGGYGDPLERDPDAVLNDVKMNAITFQTAEAVYGVIIRRPEMVIDLGATQGLRARLREQRLALREGLSRAVEPTEIRKRLMRFHEYLEVVEKNSGEQVVICVKCGHVLGHAVENYKSHALYRENDLAGVEGRFLASGERPFVTYQEYICPGCGTLLEVDVLCKELEDETSRIIWDAQIQIEPS
jgi:N-methylhydantoinase B